MKTHHLFFIFVLITLPSCLFARNTYKEGKFAHDTLVFRQLHFERIIAPTTDLRLFAKFYAVLEQGYDGARRNREMNRRRQLNSSLIQTEESYVNVYNPGSLRDMGEEEKKAPFYDAEFERLKRDYFTRKATSQEIAAYKRDSVMSWNVELKAQYCRQHGLGVDDNGRTVRFQRRKEMKDLVKRLELLRDSAENLPVFFTDIDLKFGGNIRKYVRHLYGKTIMGNMDVLYRFMGNPSAGMIQGDLGVQYAVGLALYEQWIKDVREGKAK